MKTSLLQQARVYQDMVYRYLRTCRDYPNLQHVAPEPPVQLNKHFALQIYETCEREFKRSAK